MTPGYKVGQACLRGHAVTGDASSSFSAPHCGKCGERTISQCERCEQMLRGAYTNAGGVTRAGWTPTAYCHACGGAYPWTQSKLDAVSELAEAIEELTEHEREVIRELLPHLIEETPRTSPAGFKVATIVGKLVGPGKTAMKRVLEEVAIEAGKRALGFQ